MKMRVFLFGLLALSLSCATARPTLPGGLSDSEYGDLVKKMTRSANQYDGFYQTFQAQVTFLSTALRTAGVVRLGEFQQWDAAKLQSERDRAFQEMAANAQFFMRFYTPDSDYDDLQVGTSIWKIYLEMDGKRYNAEVRRSPEKEAEIRKLFPYFDRFSTAYIISFKVPTNVVEATDAKLILTSTLGSSQFVFSKP